MTTKLDQAYTAGPLVFSYVACTHGWLRQIFMYVPVEKHSASRCFSIIFNTDLIACVSDTCLHVYMCEFFK
jgi:hypothetical protein